MKTNQDRNKDLNMKVVKNMKKKRKRTAHDRTRAVHADKLADCEQFDVESGDKENYHTSIAGC